MLPTDFDVIDDFDEEIKVDPELIKKMEPPTKGSKIMYFYKDAKERFDRLELGKKSKEIIQGTS